MEIRESNEAVVAEPTAAATCAIIWLHGVGADGRDFLPALPMLNLPESLALRWVFPQAPFRAIEMRGSVRMRAWCNFRNLTRTEDQDEAGIRESAQRIDRAIRAQIDAGIPARCIVIGGFSQGGAMALHVGLRYAERIAGIIALSCYLPIHPTVAAERQPANFDVPILMCHGRFDAVLPLAMGSMARDYLRLLGHPVEWRDDPAGHEVWDEELALIGAWLMRILDY